MSFNSRLFSRFVSQLLYGGIAGMSLMIAISAQAGLEICNRSKDGQQVAIGYSNNGVWTSEGWWTLEPEACKNVVSGALKQRYYYYHLSGSHDGFDGEGYFFCADKNAFTIEGDENCVQRGYRRLDFRKLDTGPDAADYQLVLGADKAAREKVAEHPQPAFTPGTYGEPISITGIWRGCHRVDGLALCELDTTEWTYVVADDGRTPTEVVRAMESVAVGARTTLAGDHVSTGDYSVDVVAREVTELNSSSSQARLHRALQGTWRSRDDKRSLIRFQGPGYASLYEGSHPENGRYRFVPQCNDRQGAPDAPLLAVYFLPEPEPMCYGLATLDANSLELIYLPRGNTLRYTRERGRTTLTN